MFFILSKILYYLVMPITLVILFLGFALFTKDKKRRKRALIVAFCLLYFFSNNALVNSAFRSWELPVIPMETIEREKYDVGIILTGIANTYKSPHDRPYLGTGADRVLHPVILYKKGVIKKIVISGGSGAIFPNELRESEVLKNVLITCGVPEQDILIEKTSRNTHENAVNSVALIKKTFPDDVKALLITSAFHMRRSLGCFKKEGLDCSPFPVDFRGDAPNSFDNLFIPKESALEKSYVIIHETMGYLMYSLVGYL